MAKQVEFTCKELNNQGETIRWNSNWDTYSFQDNILEPNTNHIQSVMGLSGDMTEQVVRASDYVINDWNGEENADENDESILSHENFFADKNLGFQKHKTLIGNSYFIHI
jgi:hypothetical protein